MAYKIGMVSLGCPKNQVDAEIMLSLLREAGYELTADEREAHAIIVNTCGFVEDAKRESVENILELAKLKEEGHLKALVVTGCLAERYREEIRKEIPEADAVVGIGGNAKIAEVLDRVLRGSPAELFAEKSALPLEGKRVLTTPGYTAYLKIAEGCDNCCTYCAIPLIRGRYRSRKIEDVLNEAETLARRGVRELVLVAQDTTRYGEDLYGRPETARLLRALNKISGIEWIRILYAYPERIDDEFIDAMAECEKVVRYLDMPLQHCNGEILARMNRRGDRESLKALIAKMRERLPGLVLRTTFLVGFPGETGEQFGELCRFVEETEFDRMGCFAYSREEGTAAANFENQIDEEVKKDRAERLMMLQAEIAERRGAARVGTVTTVLTEGYDGYVKRWYGRSYAEAPEIDGKIFFDSPRPPQVGEFVRVKIEEPADYDLWGTVTEGDGTGEHAE